MDRKRDGPFKVGDRVENSWGHAGSIIEVDTQRGYYVHHDKSKQETWWRGGRLTLISPATKLEAQEDVEFKKGDRVERRQYGWTGEVIAWTGMYWRVRKDDEKTTWLLHAHELILIDEARNPTTGPVAAQKETKMKAYQWVIWSLNDDGGRVGIVSQSAEAMPFKSADNAKLWAWQQFAKAGEDPDNYEVEVHPFGG